MDDKKALTELTAYQRRFVDEFMKCGNKRVALLKAGYKGLGKRSTVTSAGSAMYSTPKVLAEIQRRRDALASENLIDSKQIITRLSKMFNGDLKSQFVDKKGEVREVPITFKNQIEAAKVLVAIMGIEAPKKIEEKRTLSDEMSEEMKAMTQIFLAKRMETKKVLPEIEASVEVV